MGLHATRHEGQGLGAEKQEMVLRCLPLARGLVRSFERMFPHLAEDLRQEAYLALVQAVERYDPARGVPVEAWVSFRIKGARASYLRDSDDLTATERERLAEVQSWELEAERRLGRPPSRVEVARVILGSTVVPQWVERAVRDRRGQKWRSLETEFGRSAVAADATRAVAAVFGCRSREEFLAEPVSEEEVVEAIDAVHEIGTRGDTSIEDLAGYEPAGAHPQTETAALRDDVASVDACFRRLPVAEQVVLRILFAGIPMAVAQRVLDVSTATAYRLATSGMARLAGLLGEARAEGGESHAR